jgi:flagellar biosynthetic protein FliO
LAVTFLSLGLVCLLAYVALKWLSKRGVGQGTGPIRVLARCPLEPKRTLFLVEIAGRCFLIGAGDGPMSTLAEVDPKELERLALVDRAQRASTGGIRFAEVLARLRGRLPSSRPTPAETTQAMSTPLNLTADVAPVDVAEDMSKDMTSPAPIGERT